MPGVLDRVIQGDCLKVMGKLPAEIADLVFVDPPYCLSRTIARAVRIVSSATGAYRGPALSVAEGRAYCVRSVICGG